MTFENISIETFEPGIRLLKINRPSVLNALNSATLLELRSALSEASTNSAVRVVVLTGAGEKAFIAGADIAEMNAKDVAAAIRFSQVGHEVSKLLELVPKPTIAAVNGFALGGGCEMAISCDFILASEKAIFGQPEVGLGIIPGFGATIRLAKFVGMPMAKELIFTGRRMSAEEALRAGLVNRVFPKDQFLNEVIEIARGISRHSAGAIARSKQLMNEFSETTGLTSKLDAEAHAFGRLFGSNDQVEGMGAFLEKRKPCFKGLES